MDRVTGPDESYLMAERLFGLSAPIQYCWIFDRDPGREALESLNKELASGILARRVVDSRVPFARSRWVQCDVAPDLLIDADPIADTEVSDWFNTCVRTVALRPIDGYGWQLNAAPTDAGRYAVSLLVSHMVSDGQGIYRALEQAHHRSSTNPMPPASATVGKQGLRADLADARGQLRAAGRSVRILAATALAERKKKKSAQPTTAAAAPVPVASVTPVEPAPPPTLVVYDLDRNQWKARARELGGTSNSLFTGFIGGLVQRAHVLAPDDTMVICIAVSKRDGDDDDRANASGGVWIRVAGDISPATRLENIRALSKQAFIDYAESGADQAADNLQPVARLLPNAVIGRLMRGLKGPHTTVSNLGTPPDTALAIGGVVAESFVIRALMKGQPPEIRREKGPTLAAWATEYADKVTIAFFGIHPDHFGDTAVLHEQISAELDEWGLTHSAW